MKMDGHHSHNHSDPDLKIFALAAMGIAAIVIGPALAAAMWIVAVVIGLVFSLATIGLVAVIVYNVKQRPNLLPPARSQYPLGGNRLQQCTINRQHRAIECNGYHLEISDT